MAQGYQESQEADLRAPSGMQDGASAWSSAAVPVRVAALWASWPRRGDATGESAACRKSMAVSPTEHRSRRHHCAGGRPIVTGRPSAAVPSSRCSRASPSGDGRFWIVCAECSQSAGVVHLTGDLFEAATQCRGSAPLCHEDDGRIAEGRGRRTPSRSRSNYA